MAKTNSSFKLSKAAKWMLATYVDPHRRAEVKNIFVQCEADAEVLARTRGKSKREAPAAE